MVRKTRSWRKGRVKPWLSPWKGHGSRPHPTGPALGLVAPLTWGCGTSVQVAQLPLSLKDGSWHHICIAWTTRDGLWSAYQDGELQGSGENLAAWHPIKPHGILILGQEQVRFKVVWGLGV